MIEHSVVWRPFTSSTMVNQRFQLHMVCQKLSYKIYENSQKYYDKIWFVYFMLKPLRLESLRKLNSIVWNNFYPGSLLFYVNSELK